MSLFNCIPSLMYHHINPQPEDSISITPEKFEAQIKYLAENGYRAIHLDEFYSALKKWSMPKKTVLITFDDGYADNFIYAYPILKKYNMKATIFPVTTFINDKPVLRTGKLLNDFELLMNTPHAKGPLYDFLSWDEMRQMTASGLIDIQAHTHQHAAYFEGNKILSFHDGKMNTKLGWATNGDMRLGIPIYKIGPSLTIRRYSDDKGLRDKLATFVEQNSGNDFFMRHNAKELLFEIVKKHGILHGRFESEAESEKRIMDELKLTKSLIENKLNKKVNYICWPWGSADKPLYERAKRAGFIGGVGMKAGANMHLTNVMDIHRFNATPKTIPSLKRKLYKHSRLFWSLYNDKKIDNLLIPIKRFENRG
jgi:peptidoglycan/xylan/chitin deacetylase (PgdA/CDA1 family)